MSWIITADLHLSDKPQDDYRWGIFDFLAKQQKKHKAKGCLILGDITDEKDGHSATLVNRMIDGLTKLEPPVYILKGNHDFIDPDNPFFKFLNWVDGIHFIVGPEEITEGCFAIPHQPTQRHLDAAFALCKPDISLVLLHGLFDGAISETGQRLSGFSTVKLGERHPKLVLAGDVHSPQQVGIVQYVGAPYRIRFGDTYTPRVLLLKDNNVGTDLHYRCPTKHQLLIHSAEELAGLGTNPGDQVKITIILAREEAVQWAEHKQKVLDMCKELGLEVFGIKPKLLQPRTKGSTKSTVTVSTPLEIFESFCQAEDIRTDIKRAGKAILEG